MKNIFFKKKSNKKFVILRTIKDYYGDQSSRYRMPQV
jgi:hypothetical protein